MKNVIEGLTFFGIRLITLNYLVVRKLIKKYKNGAKRVLDLGSGNGYLCEFFNPSSYVGVEIGPGLVREAKEKYPKYHFQTGDITNLNLKKKFDLVLVIGVIHHLSNQDFGKALKTISKHLSLKGRALIVEAIPPISKFNIIGKLIRSLDRGEYVRPISDYKTRMKKNFKIIKAKEVKGGIVDYALFVLAKK